MKSDYGRESNVSGMLAELNWDTLQERRFVACQSQLWKTLHGKSAVVRPPQIMVPTIPVRGQHVYALRNPSTRTDGYKYSFFLRTVRCWNLLPTDVGCAESPEMFQNKLWGEIRLDNIRLTTPRGHSDRPRLGSCGRATEPNMVY